MDVPRFRNQPAAESGQIAPISPSAPSSATWSSAPWGCFGTPRNVRLVLYNTHFFTRGVHSPEMLRATLDHQKFTRVPSAPNVSPTTKKTRALSYASLAKTGSTLPAQHLLTPNNTQTSGPAPNVTLRPHLQSLHL